MQSCIMLVMKMKIKLPSKFFSSFHLIGSFFSLFLFDFSSSLETVEASRLFEMKQQYLRHVWRILFHQNALRIFSIIKISFMNTGSQTTVAVGAKQRVAM